MELDFSVSLELMMLLEWITKNDKNAIDNTIRHALKNGLAQKLNQLPNKINEDLIEKFYLTMINFIVALEDSLIENMHKEQVGKRSTQEILPLLKKINLSDINMQTIYQSTDQASKIVKNNNATNSQQILYERILRNWKPSKKDLSN